MSENEFQVTQKEAADFLQVSTKSISRYRKRGLPYKLIHNPVTGKPEVRFRQADLERWDEGRQLQATYGCEGEELAVAREPRATSAGGRTASSPVARGGYLDDLLLAYKEQIEQLREQLEDMRGQLARRDRQIDDLMRLMVGLRLEHKPLSGDQPMGRTQAVSGHHPLGEALRDKPFEELYQRIPLPGDLPVQPVASAGKKVFSQEQLSASILRLRRKGKSYEAIVRGLNQIEVATLSGQPVWTVEEIQALLPSLVDAEQRGGVESNTF